MYRRRIKTSIIGSIALPFTCVLLPVWYQWTMESSFRAMFTAIHNYMGWCWFTGRFYLVKTIATYALIRFVWSDNQGLMADWSETVFWVWFCKCPSPKSCNHQCLLCNVICDISTAVSMDTYVCTYWLMCCGMCYDMWCNVIWGVIQYVVWCRMWPPWDVFAFTCHIHALSWHITMEQDTTKEAFGT